MFYYLLNAVVIIDDCLNSTHRHQECWFLQYDPVNLPISTPVVSIKFILFEIQNSKYVYKNISLYLIHDILLSSSTLMLSLRNTKLDGLIGVGRTCSCSTSRPQQVQKNLFCLDCGEVWLETRNKYSKGSLHLIYLEKIK